MKICFLTSFSFPSRIAVKNGIPPVRGGGIGGTGGGGQGRPATKLRSIGSTIGRSYLNVSTMISQIRAKIDCA